MDIGLYQSASSLAALERWQDAVSQNITSSQVNGYRRKMVNFSSETAGEWSLDPNTTANGESSQSAQFPKASDSVNFMSGDPQPTGRDLDVAIQGEGFFEVQMPDGRTGYTRNGQFSLRSDRTLLSSSGAEVLSDSGSPITLPNNGGKILVNKDGSISSGSVVAGRLAVDKFADSSQLKSGAGGLFLPVDGATPTPIEQPDLLQGYVEASNVTPMREMVDLVIISRAYDANQRLIKTADEEAQKTLDALG